MKKLIFIAALAAFCSGAVFADPVEDMQKYSAGDSLEWFFQIKGDLCKNFLKPQTVNKMLAAVDSGKLDAEAFRLSCVLLKPYVKDDSDTVAVFKKFLLDDIRSSPACDVLLGLSDSDVDSALKSALKEARASDKKIPAMNAISTIAARGEDCESLAEAAQSKDKELALFATVALGRVKDSDAVDALSEILKAGDFRKAAAIAALNAIATSAYMAGDKSLAQSAIAYVPAGDPLSVYVRAALMSSGREAWLDGLIAGGGELGKAAGRAMNSGRTFENSQGLITKFPTLSDDSKLIAMASFMTAKDARFFPTIAPEIDSQNPNVRALAIYSARFLCADEAALKKIYAVYLNRDDKCRVFAANVMLENPTPAVKKVLKDAAASGDFEALVLLVKRGDIDARRELFNMFADSSKRTPKICSAVEDVATYAELKTLAKNLKGNDSVLNTEIVKLVIKKLAKTKDKEFNVRAAREIYDGNISPDSPFWKLTEAKLKIKISG